MKYRVLVPVFAQYIIDVEAENKERAAELALEKADELPRSDVDISQIDYDTPPTVLTEDGGKEAEV